MIREKKNATPPPSLASKKKYDGQDVIDQLIADHHGKCYLCELKAKQHYEVEHLKSKENYSDLEYEWTNLFLSDGYCNPQKGDRFDDILNPNDNNIEDIIEQRIDLLHKTALFSSSDHREEVQRTIVLLNRLFNGTYAPRLRSGRENEFYKEVERIINEFIQTLFSYSMNSTPETEQAVRDELSIDKELLGFKYWIIKDNPQLYAVFKDDIKWNKQ